MSNPPHLPASPRATAGRLTPGDIAALYRTIDDLVTLDTIRGSTGLAPRAAAEFRTAAARLGADPRAARDAAAVVAELGEVAAWIAHDADDQPASRRLAGEALLIARRAGDVNMERFLVSHLSMQAAHLGRGTEALALADRALAGGPRSKRVRAMFAVRRARGLALLGDRDAALDALAAARSLLADSVRIEDPQWTWWLHEAELAIHEARIRAAVGDLRGAVDLSARSVAVLPPRQGRDAALYRAWLLHDLVAVGAWSDASGVAGELRARGGAARTARVAGIVARTLALAERAAAPTAVKDALHALAV
ncbi:hypothetical protein GCM10010123_28450 [Pilimelia anulata]|uniref:Uncharacterized protein n=1 Tax=Pilimelia anulata TaxID=53371 RepID=A0A8J3BDP2_9ACTN|nr:hypothetical protein [Pilimelia anulata]GGJ96747.1 hypothetical protein GCM10010123_28450 [Pilimelia anulata]